MQILKWLKIFWDLGILQKAFVCLCIFRLEGTAHYAGLLLAPGKAFGQFFLGLWPILFLAFGQGHVHELCIVNP